MAINDTTTVSAVLMLLALAVVVSVTLGMVFHDTPADRQARGDRSAAIRRTAAVAALILGIQVTAACGAEKATPDAIDAAGAVTVQGVGSADALERRAAASSGNGHGSADSLERQLASADRRGACTISADAAERLGQAAC